MKRRRVTVGQIIKNEGETDFSVVVRDGETRQEALVAGCRFSFIPETGEELIEVSKENGRIMGFFRVPD